MKEENNDRKPTKAMRYDALICPVIGVVTPYGNLFEQWKRDIGIQLYGDRAKYRQIRRIEDIRGCEFYTVEKGYKYWEVDEDVYNAAVLRIH